MNLRRGIKSRPNWRAIVHNRKTQLKSGNMMIPQWQENKIGKASEDPPRPDDWDFLEEGPE